MKKIKLKNKKNRVSIFISTIIVIVIFAFYFIFKIGKLINNKILSFSEIEVSKLSKLIIVESVNLTIAEYMDIDKLLEVEKNSSGDIQSINLNSKIISEILSLINQNIIKYFDELENGESSLIDIEKNLITNTNIISKKNGIIFDIPVGVITNNTLLSNLGPKIPVKLSLNGELISEIRTSVESYGINNALFKVYINIKVSEQILLPISSRKITIENNIPIVIKMIQGNIPAYYFKDFSNF